MLEMSRKPKEEEKKTAQVEVGFEYFEVLVDRMFLADLNFDRCQNSDSLDYNL